MKKKDIVRSNILFNEIIKTGFHISNRYFVVCSQTKEEKNNKFGIAVGTKVGKAFLRNKIKRQIRNIIDKNFNLFPKFNNYIIICKKDILKLSFQEMEKELLILIEKGEKHEK